MTKDDDHGWTQARRIEVVVDLPLLRQLIRWAQEAGVETFHVVHTIAGSDSRGPWSDDRVTGGAGSRVVFTATAAAAPAERFLQLLRSQGGAYELRTVISDVRTDTPG